MFDFLEAWLAAGTWVAVFLIIVGFVALIKGADWLVVGASGLAKRYGMSNLVIGLTVVAFGTSMPELVVNIVAAVNHNSEIAITNILGSNIINVFVILGLSAVIYPISSSQSARNFDIPWSFLASVLVLFFAVYCGPEWFRVENLFDMTVSSPNAPEVANRVGIFHWMDGNYGFISGIGGFVLFLCFIIFMWHSVLFARSEGGGDAEIIPMNAGKAIVLIAVGILGLILGGELIVKSATNIARMLGVSDAIIGLTVVALGTSLPELATSCVAAAKHNCDLALGNVIGSNIFNILFVLSTSAMIYPLLSYDGLEIDALMSALASVLVMIFVYTNKEHEVKRWHGVVLLLIYAIYLTYRLVTT